MLFEISQRSSTDLCALSIIGITAVLATLFACQRIFKGIRLLHYSDSFEEIFGGLPYSVNYL